MANKLEREINRLSNLKQYKDIAKGDLEPIARINIEIREFHANPSFSDLDEQLLAETRFRNYLENSQIESSSDLDTLKSLIFNEVFEIRIQKDLNDFQSKEKPPPEKLTKQLVDIQNQKSSLKIKLGIDKKEEEQDDLSALQLLQKRVDNYINDHKEEFSFGLGFECQKCNHKNWETFLLYKRVKDFKSLKHPWYAGRFLFNYEIIKDVKDGKISKEDATRYLMCSGEGKFYKPSSEDKKWCVDYVEYLLENWKEITDLLDNN